MIREFFYQSMLGVEVVNQVCYRMIPLGDNLLESLYLSPMYWKLKLSDWPVGFVSHGKAS